MDAILRILEEERYDELRSLADYDRALHENPTLPLDVVLSQRVLNLLESFSGPDLPGKFKEASLIENLTGLLDRHTELHQLSRNLQKFYDVRRALIERSLKMKAGTELDRTLNLIATLPGPIEVEEGRWHDHGLRESRGLPRRIEEELNTRTNEERCTKMADELLVNQSIPKVHLQRRELALFLFRKGVIEKKLPLQLQERFEKFYPKALQLKKGCTLEILRTKDPAEAKRLMTKLHLIQCMVPSSALIDFASAYFEFRFLAPPSKPEERLKGILQTESQIPAARLWISCRREMRKKITPYLLGLQKRLAHTKAQYYLEDERPTKALEEVLKGLGMAWDWSLEMIRDNGNELLPHLTECADEDRIYFTNLVLSSRARGNAFIDEHLTESASTLYDQAARFSDGRDENDLYRGTFTLSRAVQIGFLRDEAQGLINSFGERLKEETQRQMQSLSLAVGSALGEAMSSASLIPEASGGGGNLEKLYETYRDVMLQQDPFAEETKKALKGILDQAAKMVEEAKSIDHKSASSVLEDIQKGDDKEGSKLLLDDRDPIVTLLEELYLSEDEPKPRRQPTEQVLMNQYSDFIAHVISRQIKVKNNPLLQHLGDGFIDFVNTGRPDPLWWGEEGGEEAESTFPKSAVEGEGIIRSDRYVICRMMDWLCFENEEALKVPYRKGMSVVCTQITNGIVSTREMAEKHFEELTTLLGRSPRTASALPIVESLRKADSQISSLEVIKKSGILPVKFDRSIEPRVRSFHQTLLGQLKGFGAEIFKAVMERLQVVSKLDRAEIQLGAFLGDKERDLKRYLHMNLEELTRSYLRSSNKGSLQSKISNTCLRVQQGINFRRSDARSLRYSPVVFDDDPTHSPESVDAHLKKFEEMFPIIDRISGSRMSISEEELAFDPQSNVLDQDGMREYQEMIDRFLDNALKLARQLRILIMPGQGTGNFDPTTNSLCLPMHTGNGRTEPMTILSSLADYLYHVKFLNEGTQAEEELIAVLNKKSKSSLKAGTHDSKLKVTQLLYQELGAMAGLDRIPRNSTNISSVLGQAILGKDQTMIYRDLRDLSSPQKQQRYKSLQTRYRTDRKIIPFAERVAEVAATYLQEGSTNKEEKKGQHIRVYHKLLQSTRQMIRDEIYDLGVLMYHYGSVDAAFGAFDFLIQAEPTFPEAFWGMGTTCRHAKVTVITPTEKQSKAIDSFKRFSSFKEVGPFWKKRASELEKKLMDDLVGG